MDETVLKSTIRRGQGGLNQNQNQKNFNCQVGSTYEEFVLAWWWFISIAVQQRR